MWCDKDLICFKLGIWWKCYQHSHVQGKGSRWIYLVCRARDLMWRCLQDSHAQTSKSHEVTSLVCFCMMNLCSIYKCVWNRPSNPTQPKQPTGWQPRPHSDKLASALKHRSVHKDPHQTHPASEQRPTGLLQCCCGALSASHQPSSENKKQSEIYQNVSAQLCNHSFW